MNERFLRITLVGKGERIPLHTLSQAVYHLNGLLVSSDISVNRKKTIDWAVSRLSMESPATIETVAEPFEGLDKSPEVLEACLAGLQEIDKEPVWPAFYSSSMLEHAKGISSLLDSVESIWLHSDSMRADITRQVSVNADALLEGTEQALGSIEGYLEGLNLHGRSYLNIYTFYSNRAVRCYFDEDELFEKIKPLLKKRVLAYGIIRTDRNGIPQSLNIKRIEGLPEQKDLPQAGDLKVVGRGFTNGISAEQHIRRIRDDE